MGGEIGSDYLTVCHGKIHHAIKFGKPSISMGHLYHGYVSHNQRVKVSKRYQFIQGGAPKIAKLVNITPMSRWFMVRK